MHGVEVELGEKIIQNALNPLKGLRVGVAEGHLAFRTARFGQGRQVGMRGNNGIEPPAIRTEHVLHRHATIVPGLENLLHSGDAVFVE